MKATSIQLRKSYEISVGRGATIVKVLDINPKTGAWICETQSGKEIAIGDPKRFLKAIDSSKDSKKNKPKKGGDLPSPQEPEAEPEAASSPSGKPEKAKESKPVADPEILEQLRKAVKDAEKKLRTAKTGFPRVG